MFPANLCGKKRTCDRVVLSQRQLILFPLFSIPHPLTFRGGPWTYCRDRSWSITSHTFYLSSLFLFLLSPPSLPFLRLALTVRLGLFHTWVFSQSHWLPLVVGITRFLYPDSHNLGPVRVRLSLSTGGTYTCADTLPPENSDL